MANVPLLPKTVDSGEPASLGWSLAINVSLMLAFGLHHSIFARPAFKRWWTQIVPEPIERATYVWVASLLLAAVFAFWQPLPQLVWNIRQPLLVGFVWVMFAFGGGLILYATFLIDHFELFGLRQVYNYLLDREHVTKKFVTPVLYRKIRHPLMLGWLILFWSTPQMSVGHLVFAVVNTSYIFVGILLEERTLAATLGQAYVEWRKRTPMLVPGLRFPGRTTTKASEKPATSSVR